MYSKERKIPVCHSIFLTVVKNCLIDWREAFGCKCNLPIFKSENSWKIYNYHDFFSKVNDAFVKIFH